MKNQLFVPLLSNKTLFFIIWIVLILIIKKYNVYTKKNRKNEV